jgi:hypothetical protein
MLPPWASLCADNFLTEGGVDEIIWSAHKGRRPPAAADGPETKGETKTGLKALKLHDLRSDSGISEGSIARA